MLRDLHRCRYIHGVQHEPTAHPLPNRHRIFYQGVEFVLNRQAKSPQVPMVMLVPGPPSLLTE